MNEIIDFPGDNKKYVAKTEFKIAAEKIDPEKCPECPLLALSEPTDNLINEMRAAIDRANKGLKILNLAIKERDIEITKLNNALNRHAAKALRIIH